MTLEDAILLPLRSAVFCANCETLSNETGHFCPACGSPSLFALAAVLDRKPITAAEVFEEMEFASA